MKISAIKLFLPLLLFIALGSWIYSNTLEVNFVFDDLPRIKENPYIRIDELSVDSLGQAVFNKKSSANRPLGNFSFALNYYFGRLNPKSYHVVNIVIHILTAILLYFFLNSILSIPLLSTRYSHSEVIAFFAALIWLVSPLQTQSVTYIVQRLNSMAAMFYVLSFLSYVKGRLAENKRHRWFWFIGAVLSGILALASKQNAAILPFFILLFEWYFFQDLEWGWLKRNLKFIIGVAALFCLIAFLYLGTNPIEKLKSINDFSHHEFTLTERILTQFRVVIYYLSLLFYPNPSRLNLDYDFPLSHSLVDPISTLFCLVLIIGLIGLAVYLARKERLLSFCLLWFFGNLVIESSVIPLAIIYEHRTYLPSMFIYLLAVVLVYRYIKIKWLGIALGCIVIAVFSLWTYQRNSVWSDPIAFWSDCVKKSPQKARPQNNLGEVLANTGRLTEAVKHYSEALRINPDFADAHNNLGAALKAQGKINEAIHHYREALRIHPKYVKALNNLGNALLQQQGVTDEVLDLLKKALEINPHTADTYVNLGCALMLQNKSDEAFVNFKKALQINPDIAEAHINLGIILFNRERPDEAIAHFREALRIKPDDATAQDNLKKALAILKEIDNAIADIKVSLKLYPRDYGLHYNLATLYQRKGKLDAAIDEYQQALSIEPEFIKALNNLALTYMIKNENDKASVLFTKLIALQPEDAGHYYNLACIYSRQNQVGKSIDELKKAIEIGYHNWDLIKTDKDLENIRGSEDFKSLVKDK